jgi:thioredoxin 1
MIKDIKTDEYAEEVVNASGLVLVDFWATWCGPCRMVAPILSELAEEYSEQLKIVKVNADEEPDLLDRFGISSIPTILVYNNGEVVKTIVGARPKPGLLKDIDEFLNTGKNLS